MTREEEIIRRIDEKKIQVVTINECPDVDEVELVDLDELSGSLSGSCGNVMIYYAYVPALDIVVKWVSF